MASRLEEIEREATAVADSATAVADSATWVGPDTAEGLIDEWERAYEAETKKIQGSRTAFERGDIGEEDVYRGDIFVVSRRVVIKMVASFNGHDFSFTKVATVEHLRALPAVVTILDKELRREVKKLVSKKLCAASGIDPDTFETQLFEERLAEERKRDVRDFLMLPDRCSICGRPLQMGLCPNVNHRRR
jgi:hypothetical protein